MFSLETKKLQHNMINTNETNIENEETMNLFGFWNIELSPSFIFIGDLSITLLTHLGFFFLFDSLEMTASLGVILKTAKEDMNVASSAKAIKATVALTATHGLIANVKTGIEYVLIIISVNKALMPNPKPIPSNPDTNPITAANRKNLETMSHLPTPMDIIMPISLVLFLMI